MKSKQPKCLTELLQKIEVRMEQNSAHSELISFKESDKRIEESISYILDIEGRNLNRVQVKAILNHIFKYGFGGWLG